MKRDELKELLTEARHAIRSCDHQQLYQIIAKVTNGVFDFPRSVDVFIERNHTEPDKVVVLPFGNKNYYYLIALIFSIQLLSS